MEQGSPPEHFKSQSAAIYLFAKKILKTYGDLEESATQASPLLANLSNFFSTWIAISGSLPLLRNLRLNCKTEEAILDPALLVSLALSA